MGDNATLIIFLGFAIYLMSLFPTTYCSVPVKIQSMTLTANNEQEEESSPTAGWEEMEESFVASSTGEGMEIIDMVEPEGSERLSNSAVKDVLLDAVLRIALLLLMHDIEFEIISMIMNDSNLNMYLFFMITYLTIQKIQVIFTNPGN